MAEAFDWDTPVSDNGDFSYTALPEGYYNFKVTDFQKQQFNGAGKIPKCPMAHITLAIKTDDGSTVTLTYDLKLCNSLAFLVTDFFICIGEMKPGETNKILPWDRIVGAVGRCKITQRSYQAKDKNGNLLWLDANNENTTTNTGKPVMRTVNDIKKCLPYDPKFFNGASATVAKLEEIDDGDEPF